MLRQVQTTTVSLKKSVLSDLLIVYFRPSKKDDCFRRNLLDGTIWLEMKNELAGKTGYFVAGRNDLSWVGVQKDKICYQAKAVISTENALDYLVIENYKEGYYSQIQIIGISGGQRPKNRNYE